MIYLALSVLSSVVIFIVFKLFGEFKINTLHAIVVNYIVAFICGIIAYDSPIHFSEVVNNGWFYYSLGLGALFILVFNLMALTTQRSGLSVVSVATKMSVVIPICFGLIYYKESLDAYKTLGIVLALIAVYLTSIKSRNGLLIQRRDLLFPFLVFVGSGIIDTSIKFLEGAYVNKDDIAIFSATIFGSAAIVGLLFISFQAIQNSLTITLKSVIGGIALGVPNYFSIYFLVKALRSDLLDSSGIFTVNNVGVVMISTLLGILLFKEKLIAKNWFGILLAVLSILLIMFSSL